ncbi:hypothetical protein HOU03_gp214 [Caulobacter phage CcrSC]|uniref:Uncharacterized protein n=1 Tax=Caulobacter phage CcrSC TaxID=2283272 RepID=A0A385EDU2_9CAUD|nr:hypothetical protein HOU03_gp214 [Caulobacter phage CcrSC]AXQ70054.1 hypothetical protein CcrSC_gp472 [Caulobacter phage CcrSC]
MNHNEMAVLYVTDRCDDDGDTYIFLTFDNEDEANALERRLSSALSRTHSNDGLSYEAYRRRRLAALVEVEPALDSFSPFHEMNHQRMSFHVDVVPLRQAPRTRMQVSQHQPSAIAQDIGRQEIDSLRLAGMNVERALLEHAYHILLADMPRHEINDSATMAAIRAVVIDKVA